MARIVVITHEFDSFQKRLGLLRQMDSTYLLFDTLAELKRRGHKVQIQKGPSKRLHGDMAVLHVDATLTPPDYIDCARAFPLCVNIGAADISKRRISGAIIEKGSGWSGPVIVKTDLNHRGTPERRLNMLSARAGKPPPFPNVRTVRQYDIHASIEEVPSEVLADPDLIVEKFIPEKQPDGFGARFWVFCGNQERCTLYVSPNAVVKASEATRREPVSVPEELRALRRKLGFDYGKFDFVIHEDTAVLLDANKTPSRPRGAAVTKKVPHLADGFESFMPGPR